jgi:FkbM family methyltransferase
MSRVLAPYSNCIDVGAHRGSMLRHIVRLAPRGRHYAFEPLPSFHAGLQRRFPAVTVRPVALSDVAGEAQYAHVRGRPALSGFEARPLDARQADIDLIRVPTARLDDEIPAELAVAFVKIDVEGAELRVLRGATSTLARSRPFVVFEHGVGAADLYGRTTDDVFEVLAGCGLSLSLLDEWLRNREPLSRTDFAEQFLSGANYYFLAHPPRA